VRIESAFAPIFRRLMLIRGLQSRLELDRFAFCFQTAKYLALGARAIGYTPEKPAGKPWVRSISGWMRGFTRLQLQLPFINNNNNHGISMESDEFP
jgi:hypothetical protein